MAVRAPTGPTQYIDKGKMVSAQPILFGEVDSVVDDQQFILEHARVAVADFFMPVATAIGAVGSRVEIARYYVRADRCGVSAAGYWCCAYAWLDSLTNFYIDVYDVATANSVSVNVTSAQTTKQWRGWSAGFGPWGGGVHDSEREIVVYAHTGVGGGAATVYLCGFAMFETHLL